MFEKDAEEYANGKGHEHYNYLIEENAGSPTDFARCCFKDGAEFGYNKANEWHYVKDGDLPKDEGIYLVVWQRAVFDKKYGGKFGFQVDYFKNRSFEIVGEYAFAWKEIVLPELPKESE